MFSRFRKKRIIVHCCTEKTASQWFKSLLSDPLILQKERMRLVHYNKVYEKHIINDKAPGEFYKFSRKLYFEYDPLGFKFKNGDIGTTFYMAYDTVKKTLEPKSNYKLFFILRDPRDIVISAFYSMKNSHPIENKTAEEERRILNTMDVQAGVKYISDSVNEKTKLFNAQISWVKASLDPTRERIFKYEDLASNYEAFFNDLIHFLDLKLTKNEIRLLKDKYSFENFSRGRGKGKEDASSHYRKATANQWVEVFDEETKAYFKKKNGTLIEDLSYSW